MATANSRHYSVQPLTSGLRLSAIGRRISTSGSLAIVLADLAFGDGQRSDLAHLMALTADRVSSSTGARL